jgi:hypothetical protein
MCWHGLELGIRTRVDHNGEEEVQHEQPLQAKDAHLLTCASDVVIFCRRAVFCRRECDLKALPLVERLWALVERASRGCCRRRGVDPFARTT